MQVEDVGHKLDSNPSFCLVPWIHSHISPQGVRQLCCIAENSFGVNKKLDEFWNEEDMKDIRRRMLAGEILPECNRCGDGTINPNTYRNYFQEKYGDLTDDVLSKTDSDGTYHGKPVTFDYRTNTCNFKCKICNEEFSSQIHAEKVKTGKELKFKVLNPSEREESLKIMNDELGDEDLLKDTLEFYWAGGEPMYWKTHWETLKKLVDLGYSKNVTLRYSTNLSIVDYKDESLFGYFDHFKKVELYCSLDGTGNIGEWIRSNLDYTKWRENFKRVVNYKEANKHVEVQLAVAVTTLSILDIENLYELAREFNVQVNFQTCYSNEATNLLSPKSFPKSMIKSIMDRFLERHAKDSNYIMDSFRAYFNFLLGQNFFEVQEAYDDDFRKGIEEMIYLDTHRAHSELTFEKILELDHSLLDFYMQRKFRD